MKKLAWLLGAVALVGLAACETDDAETYNCDNSINCDETTQLCVTKDYAKSGKAMCLDKATKQAVYDTCGNANATVKDQWIDEDGMCVTKYTGTCTSNADCEGDQVCNAKTGICETATDVKTGAKFVRIDDLSAKSTDKTKEDPGADIDAIVLTKADKTVRYAEKVVSYSRADGVIAEAGKANFAANPQMALGAPDSFVDYPASNDCYLYKKGTTAGAPDVDRPFVSLGGQGGYLVVEMGDIIEAGDTLTVFELGKCTLRNTKDTSSEGKTGIGEAVKVQISLSEADGTFVAIGDSSSKLSDKDFIGVFSISITDNMLAGLK